MPRVKSASGLIYAIAALAPLPSGVLSATIDGAEFEQAIVPGRLTPHTQSNFIGRDAVPRHDDNVERTAKKNCIDFAISADFLSKAIPLHSAEAGPPQCRPATDAGGPGANAKGWNAAQYEQRIFAMNTRNPSLADKAERRGPPPYGSQDYAAFVSPSSMMFGAGLLGLVFLMGRRRKRRGQLGLET
jgi:hypothetical protein